jgi:putative phosphoesterase
MPGTRSIQIGLVSDTHGVIDDRVLAALRGCRAIVHAGDVGDAAVLERLADPGRSVHAVRGNNDTPEHWSGRALEVLDRLPREVTLELPGGRLVVVHGDRVNPASRRHDRLRLHYGGARAVVYGHSHRLVVDQAAEPWILNPGAAGRARTFGGPSCIRLTIDGGRWAVESLRFPVPNRPRRRRTQAA